MTRGARTVIGGATVTAGAALIYATAVEPYALELARIEILCPRLPAAFEGYTVLQISDLHMRKYGRREQAVARIASTLTPDIIALTGDMAHTKVGVPAFLRLTESFHAKDGVFAVFGNSEHKNGIIGADLARTLEDAGITPLLNAHTRIARNADSICICGVDDPVTYNEHLADAFRGTEPSEFKLLLMHTPDLIAQAVFYGADLVLSGHTHGGQVRFPLIGAPFTRSLHGRRMSSGYYGPDQLRLVVGNRVGPTRLYVSRGIGSSGLALRFLCPPEVTMITLRSLGENRVG